MNARLSNLSRTVRSDPRIVLLARQSARLTPFSRSLLAKIHRGDLITGAFSRVLASTAWAFGLIAGMFWLYRWNLMFYELERWLLVLGFFDQIFLVAILGFWIHVTNLRAEHLEKLPAGRFVSIQAASFTARWIGESIFILAAGYLGHAFLGVPLAGIAGFWPESETIFRGGSKIFHIPLAGLAVFLGFLILLFFYSLAGFVDTLLSIEQNTRGKNLHPTVPENRGEVFGHGQAS